MSKSSSFLKNVVVPCLIIFAIVTAPVFLFLFVVLDLLGLRNPYCLTEVHERLSGLSGRDFEISETGCSTLAKDYAISVLVSKPGQRKKTLLFKYVPSYVGPYPTITSIDEHTVQISVSRVSSIFCRSDKWNDLAVKYDIGDVKHPDNRARANEC